MNGQWIRIENEGCERNWSKIWKTKCPLNATQHRQCLAIYFGSYTDNMKRRVLKLTERKSVLISIIQCLDIFM